MCMWRAWRTYAFKVIAQRSTDGKALVAQVAYVQSAYRNNVQPCAVYLCIHYLTILAATPTSSE